jgi:hypothetical protein
VAAKVNRICIININSNLPPNGREVTTGRIFMHVVLKLGSGF